MLNEVLRNATLTQNPEAEPLTDEAIVSALLGDLSAGNVKNHRYALSGAGSQLVDQKVSGTIRSHDPRMPIDLREVTFSILMIYASSAGDGICGDDTTKLTVRDAQSRVVRKIEVDGVTASSDPDLLPNRITQAFNSTKSFSRQTDYPEGSDFYDF